tara:strand:- start:5244 stop:7040 length:1797 start_codon:yes stop_codon:yes gene_type:complete
MEIYILKSAAILTVLFAFYKVFLENTSIHNFKRFYLFGSLLAAFLIPLITFTSYVEVSPIIATYTEATPQVTHTEIEKTINYWPFVLWTVYGLGVLFFGIKFFRNLFNLIQQIRKNPKYKNTPFINVLLNETVIPHTFFNYIFLNKKQFENREIPQEVIFHEETHARQKHSLDILFVALLQIVFWFNPLFYFIKKSIKLNHEFLADRAVLKTGAKISEYQKILLAFSSNAATPSLAHSLNYSSIKKRFTLMKTHTSQRAIWLRSLLILPLLSILIYGFSTTHVINELKGEANNSSEVSEVLEITIDGNENIYIDNEEIPLEIFDEKITEKNYERTSISTSSKISVSFGQHIILKLLEKNLTDGLSFCVTADGNTIPENYSGKILEPLHNYNKSKNKKATKTEIAEYNKLAKKYNAVAIENRKIPLEDLKILETIYRKMTLAQRAEAQPFPECNPSQKYSRAEDNKKFIEANYYYKGERITFEKANELLDKNKNLGMYISKEENIVHLYQEPFDKSKVVIKDYQKTPSAENGNLYMVPQAPPAHNPDPVEYVKELGKRGATFYIGPHKYSTDEAIELVQKSKEATIDVSKYPEVHLGGC